MTSDLSKGGGHLKRRARSGGQWAGRPELDAGAPWLVGGWQEAGNDKPGAGQQPALSLTTDTKAM